MEMDRFGRIVLSFDRLTKVAVRAQNGVLVIAFDRSVAIEGERIASQIPRYVSAVRRDPDGTGLRIALAHRFRPSLLEAGEKVFIDLLPADWTGLPPALPPEVVSDLARRARDAEARFGSELARRETARPTPLALRIAELPTLTRLIFEPLGETPVKVETAEGDVALHFDELLALEAERRPQLAQGVKAFEARTQDGALFVRLSLQPGFSVRSFREEGAFVLDIDRPDVAEVPEQEAVPERITAAPPAPAKLLPEHPGVRPAPVDASPGADAERQPRPAAPAAASGTISPAAVLVKDALKLTFPFAVRTAAAAIERGGEVRIVFHTTQTVPAPVLPAGAEAFAQLVDVARAGSFVVARLKLAKPALVRLAPEGDAWVLTVGDGATTPSEPLIPVRAIDDDGRTILRAPLDGASGVLWYEDGEGGERIAIVTASSSPRSVAKLQRFVEFRLLPTAHGLAVAADADDVVVRSGLDGVTISRGSGLAITLPEAGLGDDGVGATRDPAVVRALWESQQSGSVRDRYREILGEASTAPRSARSAKRLEFAHFLLANGLAQEAAGVLDFARVEDPDLSDARRFILLRAIAAARAQRFAEARTLLAESAVSEDPEGILWRAALDASAGDWPKALTGFRRSAQILDAYPDDLQGFMRALAVRAALAMRDFSFAERELTMVGQLKPGSVPREETDLLQAHLDEAVGRPEQALASFERLSEAEARPLAAEATYNWVRLALAEQQMGPEEASVRLERLSMVWRGDDIEIETIGQLGRLHAQAGRWREAFLAARTANRMFPEHPVTRMLHDETAQLFEDLFLTGRGGSLDRIEALALFFDFKEFLPIGRRGDEIVRRLADRLVELDLLDKAAELLQHQVDNRLYGAARATVAARLATIYLMNANPTATVEVLKDTRLPELPAAIKRARILLEARALSDLSRTDLALEVIDGESGPEIERLRADIYWAGRRWREAGEAHERLAGTRWQGPEALTPRDRTDVLRAAIAYSLGDEAMALDRLRAKFMNKMADSEDAATFATATTPNVTSLLAFREIARKITSADTLADFLTEYRKHYPEAAAAERPSTRAPAQAPGEERARQVQAAAVLPE